MYTVENFKTKKALKEAVASGKLIKVYQPGGLDNTDYNNFSGTVTLEGPHYPQPHRWYAVATIEKGHIVKVK